MQSEYTKKLAQLYEETEKLREQNAEDGALYHKKFAEMTETFAKLKQFEKQPNIDSSS